ARMALVISLPQEEDDLGAAARRKVDRRLQRRARVDPRARPAAESRASGQRRGALERPVAAEELGAVRGPAGRRGPEGRERDPLRELFVPRVAREDRAGRRIERRDDVRRRTAPRGSEDPFGVRRDREAARRLGAVLDRQAGDLDGVLLRDELVQNESDPVALVLEPAPALAVPREVRPVFPDGERGRGPDLSGRLAAPEKRPARGGRDRIVRPGRELVFAAVAGPRVPRAGLGDLEAEALVRDHVDPWRRGPLSGAAPRDVLAAFRGEAPEAVEELERWPRRSDVDRRRRRFDGAWRFWRGLHAEVPDAPLGERAVPGQGAGATRRSEKIAIRVGQQVASQEEHAPLPGLAVLPAERRARPGQRLERRLQLLAVRRSLPVEQR